MLALVPRDDKMRVDNEASLVLARRAAITLAAKLGFGPVERTKVATAVSELARNIVMYAKLGEVRLNVVTSPRIGLAIEARDSGPGFPDVDKVLSGGFRSKTGLGWVCAASKHRARVLRSVRAGAGHARQSRVLPVGAAVGLRCRRAAVTMCLDCVSVRHCCRGC